MKARALVALAFAALSFEAGDAHAGGLYFSDRGVRPMGRAGAFGADDLGAIWYNPAGLADAGSSVLVDFSWLRFSAEYTRELLVLDADNNYQRFSSPKVTGNAPVLPIPTIAGSYNFGKRKEWTVAGGVLAPYIALAGYPSTIDGKPSPARYALGSYDGSIAAMPGAWVAYKPIEELRFGVGVLAFVGYFQTTVTFSASPADRLLGAPEQPEFDANASIRIGPIFAPAMNGGVTYVPSKYVRFGASGQMPIVISAPAELTLQMPSSPIFDNARQNGKDAHVRFVLPGILRAGIEVRPTDDLRIEATWVHEFWIDHQAISIDPKNISLDGVTGMPSQVKIPHVDFPRGFQDSNSFRLGSEYRYAIGGYPVDLRAGMSYETSAVPKGYLSLASLDFNKFTLAIGGSLHAGKHWRFDGVYAHLFASSVVVDPTEARIPRVNPIKGNVAYEEPVNGGTYFASADLIGLGLNYLF
jgi:long-chain fatty acid transport protein